MDMPAMYYELVPASFLDQEAIRKNELEDKAKEQAHAEQAGMPPRGQESSQTRTCMTFVKRILVILELRDCHVYLFIH